MNPSGIGSGQCDALQHLAKLPQELVRRKPTQYGSVKNGICVAMGYGATAWQLRKLDAVTPVASRQEKDPDAKPECMSRRVPTRFATAAR